MPVSPPPMRTSQGIESRILTPGAAMLPGFARADAEAVFAAVLEIAKQAPFRRPVTPGGYAMSVGLTSCGRRGWVSDANGYRYAARDPSSGQSWPPMPERFRALAGRAAECAGFPGFAPDACLINRYYPGSRMSLHQDRNERDLEAPVVSVSLGLPAVFMFGGLRRSDRPQHLLLQHGDVVVWGGLARLRFHGVQPLKAGHHPLTGGQRINLTFRKSL
ncbi:MAG TPA: DNA oxidative demethylase AlkB [Gammaproteobacteria bacterium]|nr:DNA oxidative demethylase AlkB [Gammaproteobacteria bacterium]